MGIGGGGGGSGGGVGMGMGMRNTPHLSTGTSHVCSSPRASTMVTVLVGAAGSPDDRQQTAGTWTEA